MKLLCTLVGLLFFTVGYVGGSPRVDRELPRVPQGITAPDLARIPAPRTASEIEIRNYLQKVFACSAPEPRLGATTSKPKTDVREQIAMLQAVGPTNLDLLFDESLKARKTKSDRMVGHVTNEAAEGIATEEQRQLCVRAFEKDIELAGLISKMKWVGDAERGLLAHLANYSLGRDGYGGSEMNFLRACAESPSSKVQDALTAFLSNPANRALLSGLSINSGGKVSRELAVRVWSKVKNNPNAPAGWAVLAMEGGDVSALRFVVESFRIGEGAGWAKQRASQVVKVTGAPKGTPSEVADWVLSRIAKLKWDETAERFVEK